MELDELKKSWNVLNERFEKNNPINEESVDKLIREHKELADYSKAKLLRNGRRTLIIGLLLMVILITSFFIQQNHNVSFVIVYFITFLFLGCLWDSYTYYYLRNTNIEKMPVKTVVKRITRCHQYLICEYYVSAIFFLSCIIIQAYTSDLIHKTWQQQVMFIVLWLLGGCIAFWIIKKAFHNKIINIKKNLADLQDIK